MNKKTNGAIITAGASALAVSSPAPLAVASTAPFYALNDMSDTALLVAVSGAAGSVAVASVGGWYAFRRVAHRRAEQQQAQSELEQAWERMSKARTEAQELQSHLEGSQLGGRLDRVLRAIPDRFRAPLERRFDELLTAVDKSNTAYLVLKDDDDPEFNVEYLAAMVERADEFQRAVTAFTAHETAFVRLVDDARRGAAHLAPIGLERFARTVSASLDVDDDGAYSPLDPHVDDESVWGDIPVDILSADDSSDDVSEFSDGELEDEPQLLNAGDDGAEEYVSVQETVENDDTSAEIDVLEQLFHASPTPDSGYPVDEVDEEAVSPDDDAASGYFDSPDDDVVTTVDLRDGADVDADAEPADITTDVVDDARALGARIDEVVPHAADMMYRDDLLDGTGVDTGEFDYSLDSFRTELESVDEPMDSDDTESGTADDMDTDIEEGIESSSVPEDEAVYAETVEDDPGTDADTSEGTSVDTEGVYGEVEPPLDAPDSDEVEVSEKVQAALSWSTKVGFDPDWNGD